MDGETPPTITEAQRDKIAHAIGHPTSKSCSTSGGRNAYCGAADDPDWSDLVDRGMAERRKSKIVDPSVYYLVTPQGREALDHHNEANKS